jgi:hypothetical protein
MIIRALARWGFKPQRRWAARTLTAPWFRNPRARSLPEATEHIIPETLACSACQRIAGEQPAQQADIARDLRARLFGLSRQSPK